MIFLDLKTILGKEVLDEILLVSCSSHWKLVSYSELIDKYDSKTDLFIRRFKENQDKQPIQRYKVIMNGYLVSLFYEVLNTSMSYRSLFANHVLQKTISCDYTPEVKRIRISLNIIPPKHEMIDYKGNEMLEISCLERRELDNAMAWLSTLGGAFSALGDSIEKCATIAGNISIRQLEIASKLGDPYLIARCKLYIALSLIQKHRFKQARYLIKDQYVIACSGPILDHKLKSMCLGIWTKLKYDKEKIKKVM